MPERLCTHVHSAQWNLDAAGMRLALPIRCVSLSVSLEVDLVGVEIRWSGVCPLAVGWWKAWESHKAQMSMQHCASEEKQQIQACSVIWSLNKEQIAIIFRSSISTEYSSAAEYSDPNIHRVSSSNNSFVAAAFPSPQYQPGMSIGSGLATTPQSCIHSS